jgi:uncharacterized protein YndB with AHSA1/START domain
MAEPETDASDREIVSSRTFDASRERVFDAFADPARLARWWGPEGFTNTFQRFELRPGGRWRFTMHAPDGTEIPNESVFLEVVRPERIAFRHLSREHPYDLTITLDQAEGGTTRVTWRMLHPSAEVCARVRPFVVAGNEQNFDRLGADLGASSAPR